MHYDNDNLQLQFNKTRTGSKGASVASEVFFKLEAPRLLHLLLTFILSNTIFFYEERLLQQSRDGAQLLVWVYCS